MRFEECRTTNASLAAWRELQLEILDAAKQFQRDAVASASSSRIVLWSMLGDAFWMERDPSRLSSMIDEVIGVLERDAR